MSAASPPTPDGDAWAAETATRRNGAQPPPGGRETVDRLVVLGYIAAVSMPPVGFALALVIAFRDTRSSVRHALLIFGLGVIACAMWAAVISSGALTATDTSF